MDSGGDLDLSEEDLLMFQMLDKKKDEIAKALKTLNGRKTLAVVEETEEED